MTVHTHAPRRTPRHHGDEWAGPLVTAFAVRWLVRLYAEFDGDVLAAVVLGELSLRDGFLSASRGGPEAHLHANAFAIAHATGIPRETVRRKLSALERRGWIRRDAKGELEVTPRARQHFGSWCTELRDQLRELACDSKRSRGRA